MCKDIDLTKDEEEIDMSTAKVIEINSNVEIATKEEVDKLYQYFAKKNKNIYEKLAK